MAKGILGRKVGMTQVFSETGNLVPVTVIDVTPNVVLQKKTVESDGYNAVQVGYCDITKNAIKPQTGHAQKAQTTPKRFVKEIAGDEMLAFDVGQEVKANIFAEGELVDVTGTSKGKGYQGVIKRHNYSRGPMSHGSGFHRGIGSMGPVDAAHIRKGKKMPGQTGSETITVQNLELIKYDAEKNIILVKGNVPGAKNSFLVITNAVKAKSPAINPEALA